MRSLLLIGALALALNARIAAAMEFRSQPPDGSSTVLIIATGEILMLSDWHVLQGPEGQLGEHEPGEART